MADRDGNGGDEKKARSAEHEPVEGPAVETTGLDPKKAEATGMDPEAVEVPGE
jgi:hypothetical protein